MATSPSRSLGELAAQVGGELQGDSALSILGVNGLAEALPGQLSFFGNAKYKAQLKDTRAAAVLSEQAPPGRPDLPWIRVAVPHLAFARISQLFHPRPAYAPGIHSQAHVHPQAQVAASATVMAGATVEPGARVGERSVLFPGVYLGEGASVGDDCLLYPNVTVREGCLVGHRNILHASCVIGADGFGFALDLSVPEHVKIPQAGIVRLEDDVEIGACACVDRATNGETVVGRGTKVDNLVQIGHNARIGPLSILCAHAGIMGSAELGMGVMVGGQAGINGHIKIGDRAMIYPQAGVAQELAPGETVTGTPAIDHKQWVRAQVVFKDLVEIAREVRALRKQVDLLSSKKAE